MADTGNVELSILSRYRRTDVLQDVDVPELFFDTWVPPEIIRRNEPTIFVVTEEEVGRPDLISFRVYGDSDMFWAIAIQDENQIFNPLRDITVGQKLTVPHKDDVLAALLAG